MIASRPLLAALVAAPLTFGLAAQPSAHAKRGVRVARITIRSYAFRPQRLVVGQGSTVVWTNRDPDKHTVTGDKGSAFRFNSRTLDRGATVRFTFKRAGVYRYHCAYHPFMQGTIVVRKRA